MMDALKLSQEFGADEAIEDEAINRYATATPKTVAAVAVAVSPAAKPVQTASTLQNPATTAINTREQAAACKTREELEAAVRAFKGISITKTATNTVFSDGVATSEIMLIGEAPGAEEDAQGIPFCGPSGQMLDQMLSYIGLSRATNFYITNTIFWRPPGNRRPTPEELAICLPYVEKHIALIKPKLIVLVGGTAVAALLDSKLGITKIRGNFFDYTNPFLDGNIPTTAIFHPSYLLRSPGQKQVAWHDALMLKQYIKEQGIRV